MTRRRKRVLIIGAGVAGLTAGIALRRAGHDVLIFERQPEIRPLGAGLILWSNAISAMRYLDLESATRKIGAELGRASVLDTVGTVLSSTDALEVSRKAGAPTLAVHRADLMITLRQRIPKECFRFSHNLVRYEVVDSEVVAEFEDGRLAHGDFLVGADGIWSTVRSQIHGDQPPRYAGYTAWRSVIQQPDSRVHRSLQSTETWGPGRRFGWVPMSQGRVYWFATRNAPENEPADPRGHRAELLDLFGTWHRPIPETIEASDDSQILRHDIYDRPPSSNWGIGPVTLAGDAAHPTTPNTGQGAAMAIEDAVVLANCLSGYATIEAALRAYEIDRYPRTSMITNLSERIGRMAQMENPYASLIRNMVMRALPKRISAGQFEKITAWAPPASQEISE